ncbi:hypothetical protein V2G26_004380 [Clonostachys chloroleuca]
MGRSWEIYLSLLRRIRTYPNDTAIEIKAAAIIMQFWRQVVFVIETKMAQGWPLQSLERKLEKQLRDHNEKTFLELQSLYITQGRGRAWEDDRGNTEEGGLESVRDEFGITPAHKLARSDELEKKHWQITGIPDTDLRSADVFGWTPLHYVSTQGRSLQKEWVVRTIIESYARSTGINARDLIEWTPLHYACSAGGIVMVQTIIRFGTNVKAQGTDNFTPLHCADYHGHEEIVATLIEAGADVNFQDVFGNSPLFWAIKERRKSVCDLLYGNTYLNKRLRNFKGMTALHQAAGFGDQAIVELLLHDQDVNAKDRYQHTPLHLAAETGHEAVVRLLCEKGACTDAQDDQGWIPLHTAASYGHEAIARLLLEKGANIEAQNKYGWTPLYTAVSYGHEVIAKLLRENGAK